jgi:DNA-binding transcriptional ArsR family regulator
VPLTHRRVTDARDLSALAHPLRIELLELLLVNGPMTASAAARELDVVASNASWHLRKLAERGYVRQSTSGRGRERPWRIVAEALSWGDDAEDAAMSAAVRDVALEREVQVVRTALASHRQRPPEWREATRLTSARLWLTPTEAADIGERIAAVLEPYAGRLADTSQRPDGARLVAVMNWLVPARPEPPEPAAQPPDPAPTAPPEPAC